MSRAMYKSFWKRIWPTLAYGSIKSKLFLLAGMVLLLVMLGAVTAHFAFGESIGDALWWSWTHALDPGFVGDDKESLPRKLWGSIFAIAGLILIGGAFITLAEEAAHLSFERMMHGRLPKGLNGHTVIAGRGQKLVAFVTAARNFLSASQQNDLVVVAPDIEALSQVRKSIGQDTVSIVDQLRDGKGTSRLELKNAQRIILLDNFSDDTGLMLDTILSLSESRKLNSTKNTLTIYAEVNNRELINGIRSVTNNIVSSDTKMQVHIVNICEASARLALKANPLDCIPVKDGKVTLIIEGWTSFAQSLFWQAVRVAHFPVKPTRIVIVHPDAELIKNDVLSAAPNLTDQWCVDQLADVSFVSSINQQGLGTAANDIVTLAVCNSNNDLVFARAIQATETQLPGLRQVYLELSDGSGYKNAAAKIKSNIKLIAVGEHAQAFELAEKLDEAAKRLHEIYIKQRTGQKKRKMLLTGQYESKSDYDWEQLDETRRSWNRASADHIDVKLRALADYYNISLADRGVIDISALEDKIKAIVENKDKELRPDLELLARLEHDRWSAEKIAEGWAYAAEKDENLKKSPYIRAYDQLSEEIKGYDRNTVIKILANLSDKPGNK